MLDVHKFEGTNNLDSDKVEDILEVMDLVRDYRAQGNTVPFPELVQNGPADQNGPVLPPKIGAKFFKEQNPSHSITYLLE